jgi:hypothetical protein
MGSEYELYVRHEVHLRIGALRSRSRAEIMHFLDSLSSDPFQKGDYQDRADPNHSSAHVPPVIDGDQLGLLPVRVPVVKHEVCPATMASGGDATLGIQAFAISGKRQVD